MNKQRNKPKAVQRLLSLHHSWQFAEEKMETEWFAQGQSQNGTWSFWLQSKRQQLACHLQCHVGPRLGRAGLSVLHSRRLCPSLHIKVLHSSFWSIIYYSCSWWTIKIEPPPPTKKKPNKTKQKCGLKLNWISLGLGSFISKMGTIIHLFTCSLNKRL